MGSPLIVRSDLEAAELRRVARRERDGRVVARLIALANVLDGMTREAAARAAGMDRMTEGQQATRKAVVLRSPDPERDGIST
jgi:hypothetical protein